MTSAVHLLLTILRLALAPSGIQAPPVAAGACLCAPCYHHAGHSASWAGDRCGHSRPVVRSTAAGRGATSNTATQMAGNNDPNAPYKLYDGDKLIGTYLTRSEARRKQQRLESE